MVQPDSTLFKHRLPKTDGRSDRRTSLMSEFRPFALGPGSFSDMLGVTNGSQHYSLFFIVDPVFTGRIRCAYPPSSPGRDVVLRVPAAAQARGPRCPRQRAPCSPHRSPLGRVGAPTGPLPGHVSVTFDKFCIFFSALPFPLIFGCRAVVVFSGFFVIFFLRIFFIRRTNDKANSENEPLLRGRRERKKGENEKQHKHDNTVAYFFHY